MNDQLKRYIDPIVRFWKNLTKKKKIIICSVLGGIVVLAVAIEILLSLPSYTVLYPNLSSDEATQVINELKSRNIDYKENNGTISVPKDKENSIRMELANEGYPKTTLNYDFFTSNNNVMTTDKERQIIEKYQLNQRLESVIKTFDCIQNATVTISIPDDSTYAWDTSKQVPSASVTVTQKSGKTLQSSQVNGIKQLVAKSVPNLTVDNVAVIDTATGNELDASSDDTTSISISEFKRTIEKEYEDDICASALKVLKPIYGDTNVQVTAKSVMDVDKKVSEILTYIPSQDNKGVVSESTSDQEQQKGAGTTTGSAVGTQSNTENTTSYSGVTVNGDTIYAKDAQTYKYLVSQTKEQIQGDAASLKDLTISVVVNQASMDDVQKTEIGKMIAYAAAIDPSKVNVYSTVFASSNTQTADTQPKAQNFNILYLAAGAAAFGLVLILLIFFWILSSSRKRKLKRLLKEQKENEESSAEEPAKPNAATNSSAKPAAVKQPDINAIIDEEAAKQRKELEALHEAQQSRENELRKDLQEFSSQNPEIVAQLIKSWLRGDDNNG